MKEGWELRPLSDLCEFQRGLTYSKGDETDSSSNVVLRANNVDLFTNQLDLSELKYISDLIQIPSSKVVRRGSLLVCTASGSKSHLGKVAIIDKDYGYAFGGFMGQITPLQTIHPRFLFYALTTESYKSFISALSDGANINNLKFGDLGRFQIPVPSLPEQQRIVAWLDEAFEALATSKANAEQNLTNARALFASHLESVFGQRGKGWTETTLDKISTNLDSQRIPITRSLRESGDYPYYGASGIVDHVADYIFEGDNLLISEDGANLLARSTPIAFSVSGRYWVNNHAHILHFEHMAAQRFVEFYLESIRLDEYITGAAQPKLNQKALNSIPIPVPETIEAQAQIVKTLESLQAETQRLGGLYERKLATLEGLKKSLLHQALSGEM
jgi:type I restriction enzyme S subunit